MTSVASARFAGKVPVVTGGSRGIGAAIAARPAGERAAMVIGYRGNREAADKLVTALRAEGGRAIAVRADVADPDQVKALIEHAVAEFGQLGVLASCQGIEHFDALENITPADFDRIYTSAPAASSSRSSMPRPTCANAARSC